MALGFEESFSVKFPLYDFTSAISSTKSGLSVKIITVISLFESSSEQASEISLQIYYLNNL